jgi:hypothetical protein
MSCTLLTLLLQLAVLGAAQLCLLQAAGQTNAAALTRHQLQLLAFSRMRLGLQLPVELKEQLSQ